MTRVFLFVEFEYPVVPTVFNQFYLAVGAAHPAYSLRGNKSDTFFAAVSLSVMTT